MIGARRPGGYGIEQPVGPAADLGDEAVAERGRVPAVAIPGVEGVGSPVGLLLHLLPRQAGGGRQHVVEVSGRTGLPDVVAAGAELVLDIGEDEGRAGIGQHHVRQVTRISAAQSVGGGVGTSAVLVVRDRVHTVLCRDALGCDLVESVGTAVDEERGQAGHHGQGGHGGGDGTAVAA